MKNYLITLALLISLLGAGFDLTAQSFEIRPKTTTVNAAADQPNELGHFEAAVGVVRAATNGADNVSILEIERNVAEGHHYFYCWDEACVPTPDTMVNKPSSALFGRSGEDELKLQYYANDIAGQSTIKYRISNANNPADMQEVTFTFNITPVGIFRKVTMSAPDALSAPYPCPASDKATLSYHVPANTRAAYIKLYDLMGRELGRFELNQPAGEVVINVRNLTEGVYFYALIADNQTVSSKRLIVSR